MPHMHEGQQAHLFILKCRLGKEVWEWAVLEKLCDTERSCLYCSAGFQSRLKLTMWHVRLLKHLSIWGRGVYLYKRAVCSPTAFSFCNVLRICSETMWQEVASRAARELPRKVYAVHEQLQKCLLCPQIYMPVHGWYRRKWREVTERWIFLCQQPFCPYEDKCGKLNLCWPTRVLGPILWTMMSLFKNERRKLWILRAGSWDCSFHSSWSSLRGRTGVNLQGQRDRQLSTENPHFEGHLIKVMVHAHVFCSTLQCVL